MSLLTPAPVDPTTTPAAPPTTPGALRGRWPLAGLVAGAAAFAFPITGATMITEEVADRGPLAVYEAVKDEGVLQHVSMDLALVAALALTVFGVGFARFLASRTPADSLLVPVARAGIAASVGLSFLVAMLKMVYRGGLPDHLDSAMYSRESVGVFHSFVDQLQYVGMWPIVLTMGVVAVVSFRHRALPRWYGGLSAFLVVTALGMALGLGLPYFVGVVGPVWLVASSIVVLRHRDRAF